MSENKEAPAFCAEENANLETRFDPMAALPANQEKKMEGEIQKMAQSLDSQSHSLGEVVQSYLVDPQALLPLNSDRLAKIEGGIEAILSEVSLLIEREVDQIQKVQKKITLWEDRIEKNKAVVQKHLSTVKQNLTDIAYDKKNRDYWVGRAEQVALDYEHAEAGSREEDWAWLFKKYGLKNPDGTFVDPRGNRVAEVCKAASSSLMGEYRAAGNKYEHAKKEKEEENIRLIHDNSRLLKMNEELQGYVSNTYTCEIEPLQDGILLYKELSVKLKALGQEGNRATCGDLRFWAEGFLDEFLKTNSRVPQQFATEFRRLTSIPLPAKHS